ncbi:MAG: hypothetical protein JO142_18725 [Burkholderiales bacterium]|nr:hypothetical protein [Burkholderiales bacterium]
MERVETGECSGSFGELLQGVLPDGEKFLINLKLKNRSVASVTLTTASYDAAKEAEFARSYATFPKTHKVLRNIMVDLGRHDDLLLHIDSTIPVGKGLSSSTADMVASIEALEKALSVSFKRPYISRMLTEIEPNDGLHYEGTSAYHHAKGKLIESWSWVPNWRILGLDFGGVIDTVEFNRRNVVFPPELRQEYAGLLATAVQAFAAEDRPALAKVATRSAELWQSINPKASLPGVLQFAQDSAAEGVVNAHSGTYLGLLYSDETHDWDALLERAARAFPEATARWYDTATSGATPPATQFPRD